MKLYKEVYRHAGSTTIKETFFNKDHKIAAVLDLYKAAETSGGDLTLYAYTGESYQLTRYKQDTNTYKRFLKEGVALFTNANWYTTSEAHYQKDCKIDKGLLLEEHTHNFSYEEKHSVVYTYNKGLKVSENSILADGTDIRINYVYDNKGLLLSRSTLKNNIFQDQVNYSYLTNGQLALEQTFHSNKGQNFLAAEKKYHYNPKNQLEKTEYYGRYNGQLHLYKTEEEIRQNDLLTKKSAGIPAIDIAIGHYDLAAMHTYFRENDMEGYIAYFDQDFTAKNPITPHQHVVEKLDEQGNPVETHIMDPEKPENQLTMAAYRNEYNEAGKLEFMITYILNEQGQMEENSIKKLYYLL
ncbi:hypothetical protein SAMN05444266_10382 [Chitinophaga jiangningensis]|uniref:YD repeat-containing protein n=1 Tax=Chitinophaga jiangningensis TaxID=1419482 RepID=A0A1M7A1C6_9BACT|nr:hypothetical protein [Chitinophaga jiangningensis]SHL36415.1 hypothetical protein SAMN05444266_10382 [Chitinophaga jiangningensis]